MSQISIETKKLDIVDIKLGFLSDKIVSFRFNIEDWDTCRVVQCMAFLKCYLIFYFEVSNMIPII